MSLLHVEGVTHWSIPVNNLEEAEDFYGELLGLTPVGRLGNARISCFTVGAHHILLCERAATIDHTFVEDPKVHHSFTVSPETLVRACKLFRERHIRIEHLYPGGNSIFWISVVTGWNCATRPGTQACRSRPSRNSPIGEWPGPRGGPGEGGMAHGDSACSPQRGGQRPRGGAYHGTPLRVWCAALDTA